MNEEHRSEPEEHVLSCHHCGGTEFARRTAQLNTPFLTFLSLDWLNATADLFVCDGCGYLHWFLNPEIVTEDDPLNCMACGAPNPQGQDACFVCGWAYPTGKAEEEEEEEE